MSKGEDAGGAAALKERMAERLAKLGMSRPALAERTGDSVKNLDNWLGGSTRPPVDFVVRFAQATGTGLDWLLTGERAPEAAHLTAAHLERIRELMAPLTDEELLLAARMLAVVILAARREGP